MTAKAKRHIDATRKHGRDLHACPQCGRLYECEAITWPDSRHYVSCAEHGQQVGVGSYYIAPGGAS